MMNLVLHFQVFKLTRNSVYIHTNKKITNTQCHIIVKSLRSSLSSESKILVLKSQQI